MNDTDFDPHRLSDPIYRESVLRSIQPTRECAKNCRSVLLSILPLEMAYRADETNDGEYYENIYWCAFLLYLAGNSADVPLMWRAKHVNMDTGGGFDAQCFVGAGIDETVDFLLKSGECKIAEYIKDLKEAGDFDDLSEWESWKSRYYYENKA